MKSLINLYGAVLLVLIAVVAEAPGHGSKVSSVKGSRGGHFTDESLIMPRDNAGHSPYLVINIAAGRISLRTADSVLLDVPCSAGSGATLRDSPTSRVWNFSTPTGVFEVTAKAEDPIWRKPDWAYLEEGLPVPGDPALRLEEDQLGGYSIDLGDGLYIHGTVYTRLLGMNATHGCIRVADEDLEKIYRIVEVGTPVFIL